MLHNSRRIAGIDSVVFGSALLVNVASALPPHFLDLQRLRNLAGSHLPVIAFLQVSLLCDIIPLLVPLPACYVQSAENAATWQSVNAWDL